jgi:hypothetical protein
LAAVALLAATLLNAKVFDGGVDSANLGKGEWVYVMSDLFAGYAPGVTDVPSFMNYCANNLHCQFVVVKSATGSTNYPSPANPQFTAGLVDSAHAAGLKIFGYTRSYGSDIAGEIAAASYVFNCGADGFILDAEAEWESGNVVGTNGPALAWQLCGGIKTNWPTKFLAHSPFAVISYHSSFPYQQFGYWCDAAMPQDYWVDFGKTPTATVQWMDSNWGPWQSGLTGMWTNAIKPLCPIGQADSTSQPGTDITEFVNYLKTDPGCVTAGGYKGCAFFRPGLQTAVMLSAISSASIGSGNTAPFISTQPQGLTVFVGQNAVFTVSAGGYPSPTYQWKWNAQTIPGATSASYTRGPAQLVDAGTYTVVVSNSIGVVTSSNAVLAVSTNVVVPASIIIDNTSLGFTTTGSWIVGTSSADKYGASYDYATAVTGAATATATYTPTIVTGGNYDVFIWYPEGGNRSANAPWSVTAASGTVNTTVNQQATGGQWFKIASNVAFNNGTGGYVRVANNAGPTVVMADAVELVFSPVQPPYIAIQPQSQTGLINYPTTFAVQAGAYGTSALSYQWSFNGTNQSGATKSALTIASTQAASAGSYAVTVGDSVGNIASVPAVLTVRVPVITFSTIEILPGNHLHVQVSGDPVNVVLQSSPDMSNWSVFASGSLSNGPADFYDSITNSALFYRVHTAP